MLNPLIPDPQEELCPDMSYDSLEDSDKLDIDLEAFEDDAVADAFCEWLSEFPCEAYDPMRHGKPMGLIKAVNKFRAKRAELAWEKASERLEEARGAR